MSIPRITAFQNDNYLKPSDDIDPNKKSNKPDYSRDYSKWIYSRFMKDGSAIKSDMAARFVRNRKYAEGRQETQQYKDWIFGGGSNDVSIPVSSDRIIKGTDVGSNHLNIEDLGIDNVNFDDVFSPLPKYVENIVGIMRSNHHDIVIDAIDENSGTAKEEMKFGAYISAQMKALLVRFNTVFGIPDTKEQPVLPASLQELELFDNIGAFKLPYEIAMEKAIAHTFDISQLDDSIKDDIIADLIIDNYACLVTIQNPNTGKFEQIRKDVLEIVMEDSKRYDFSDSSWGGYIEYYTIAKLRTETGWDEKVVQDLAEKYKGQFENPQNFDSSQDHGRYKYDDYRVPVLHSFWRAFDKEFYSERNTSNGPIQKYEPYKNNGKREPKARNGRKLDKVTIRRLYNAKWVIDSEEVFNYGIVTNTPYNFGENDVEFPIRLARGKGKSKIESMIPIEDQIFLTFLKTQNAIAKAAPPGIAIEWGSMQNISFGKKKLTAKDSLRLYSLDGNIIYQLDAPSVPGQRSGHNPGKAVEELRGGLGNAITDGIQGIEFLYRQLDVITGIDGITSVTQQPNRDTGKAVTEMAVSATSNTLKPIYNQFLYLKKASAKITAWQIQALVTSYSVKDLEDCPYFRALGRANLIAILTAGNFPPVVYGFIIEARATDGEKQRILETATAALQSGKNGIPAITYSEYSFILRFLNSGKSIKYLELWMAKKEQERAVAEQKRAEQNIKVQSEEQRKTDQQKSENEKNKVGWEQGKELAIIQAKGEQERATQTEKYILEEKLLDKQMRLQRMSQPTNTSAN